jgi:hypothetical protein
MRLTLFFAKLTKEPRQVLLALAFKVLSTIHWLVIEVLAFSL